jgi:hypothetical protein
VIIDSGTRCGKLKKKQTKNQDAQVVYSMSNIDLDTQISLPGFN